MRLNRGTLTFLVVLAVIIIAAALLLRREPTTPTTNEDVDPTSEPQNLFPDITADSVIALSITRRLEASDATPTAMTQLRPVALRLVLDAAGQWTVAEELSAAPPEATAEATAETTAEATAEGIIEATAEMTVEATADVTEEATVEVADVTPEATADVTEEATVEAADVTPEATAETTAEATAESTMEATAEATAEITPEATAEVTPEAVIPQQVDQTLVAQAISTLLGLRYRDSFETDNLAQFGLDDPTYDINFTAGGTNYRLQIGDKNIGGTQYYALLGDDGKVYILTSASDADKILNLLNNSPYVIPPTPTPVPVLVAPGPVFTGFNAQTITSFTLSDAETGQELVLVRDPETTEWTIAGSDATVQQQLVDLVLGQFGTISAVDKVPSSNLAALGLDNPRRFALASVDDQTNFVVALGITDPTGTRYYARVNDYADIAVIETNIIDFVFDMLENPPIVPEATPEVTAEATAESTAEATAEATEASGD